MDVFVFPTAVRISPWNKESLGPYGSILVVLGIASLFSSEQQDDIATDSQVGIK